MLIETRPMWRLPLMALLFSVGCTTPNPRSCLDNFCEDPGLPFCDADGAVSGEPGTCVAVTCEPLAFETCRGDEALICNSSGDNFDVTNCANGCLPEEMGCAPCEPGSPGCTPQIVPKFLPTICNSVSLLPDYVILQSTEIDTSNEATCTGGVYPQSNGIEICVIRAPSIRIAAGATFKVRGSRAIALVADRGVALEGDLDISADGSMSGPGGRRISGSYSFGAGFATMGGMGSAGMLGLAISDPVDANSIVVGGSPEADIKVAGIGGGGGGAGLLIACQDEVAISGQIDAGGGGGGGFTDKPGGGGGTGGYVVIQGMNVEINGRIFANGGGGGGGGNFMSGGGRGSDGALSRSYVATGGTSPSGAPGGDGGQQAHLPGHGSGGGGSVGMIQIFTPANVPPATLGATVSPDFRPHRTVETK